MKTMFEEFCITHSYWLDDYSQYWALKVENEQASWIDWKIKTVQNTNHLYEAKVIQFIFHDQWNRLRQYCQDREVQIIGDMPIYVGYDSSDVYANRTLFELNSFGKMIYQGGCPPCEYQSEGQLWSNPLYDWENHEKTNFKWWQQRFKKLLEMVDTIRLDHFIGYTKYYRIPIGDQTAHNGEWIPAPGDKLFQVLESTITDLNVIAEDLGDVSDEVIELRNKYNFPGMRVLHFEFGEQVESIKSFPYDSVTYTGTHDNNTSLGWLNNLDESEIDYISNNLNSNEIDVHWRLIDHALQSGSRRTIIPIQDVLGLDEESRFNKPGTLSNENWSWRLKDFQLTSELKLKIRDLTLQNNRMVKIQVESLEVEL